MEIQTSKPTIFQKLASCVSKLKILTDHCNILWDHNFETSLFLLFQGLGSLGWMYVQDITVSHF